MKKKCYVCDREFSTPFNMRRHMDRQHPLDPYTKPTSSGESDSESTTNNTNEVSEDKDYSEGGDTDSSINDYSEDDASVDTESMATHVSSDQESENENWVFDRFKHFSQEQEEQWTLKEKREEFRSNYANFLEWYSHLKKNEIHKKVMATVKELDAGDGDYDSTEALHLAVEMRRYLLDRLIEEEDTVMSS